MRKILASIIPLFILTLGLTGCVSQREKMIKEGYPPAYADGYQDGCSSGNNAGGSLFYVFKKNIKSYSNDINYQKGWDDGFRQCKARQKALQRQYQTTIEQQRLIEEKRHNKKVEDKDLLKGIDTSGLENLK